MQQSIDTRYKDVRLNPVDSSEISNVLVSKKSFLLKNNEKLGKFPRPRRSTNFVAQTRLAKRKILKMIFEARDHCSGSGGYLLVISDGQHLIPKTSHEMLVAGYVGAEHRERMPAVPSKQREHSVRDV